MKLEELKLTDGEIGDELEKLDWIGDDSMCTYIATDGTRIGTIDCVPIVEAQLNKVREHLAELDEVKEIVQQAVNQAIMKERETNVKVVRFLKGERP